MVQCYFIEGEKDKSLYTKRDMEEKNQIFNSVRKSIWLDACSSCRKDRYEIFHRWSLQQTRQMLSEEAVRGSDGAMDREKQVKNNKQCMSWKHTVIICTLHCNSSPVSSSNALLLLLLFEKKTTR